ncbi:MAG TPA: proprotein convertase P-domain-containing protein, partial [Verrucomicrobiae bacterium]|nr:proprotein convertase P-domain-containing protein [Verrucomicrobiae bacterium]
YIGSDFRAAYVPGTVLTGAGQTVGLFQFDGYLQSDILAYEALAGLPNVPLQNVLLDGYNGVPTGNGGEIEVSLDIEMSISMAPGLSQIIVYEAGPFGFPNDILNRMATDNAARQLSCSWGWSGGPQASTDQIFQQIAAQGQTFFDASGDNDAFGPGAVDDPTQTGAPSDNPYIIQVGGTTLTTSGPGGAWVSETVWSVGGGIGSSGGISVFYPIPSWQQGVSMTNNQGSTTFRNLPDVAMTADNVYVIADNGTPYPGTGGTSCAAPLWAGFTALVNQQAAAHGEPAVGFFNPAIYAIGTGTNYSADFHDITIGNNTNSSSPTMFFAVPGYDLCTGWGSPTGTNLINALVPPTPLPVLAVYTNIISGGNGNGTIDPDECNSMFLVLTNMGLSNATTVLVTLSTTTPGVLLVQPTSFYPNIPAGGVGTNLVAFKVSTSPFFVCGTPVALSMVLKSDQLTMTNQLSLSTGGAGFPLRFDNNSVVTIPVNDPVGTNSIMVVTNITSTLMHVAVSLNIVQPVVGDLTLQLISPDGTTNTLAQNRGGIGQNFGLDCNSDIDRTTFDDNGFVPIAAGSAPFVGTFQPDSPLSVFNGKSGSSVNGAWKLRVVDPFTHSSGSIQCWSLILTPANCTDGGGQCPGVDLALGMGSGPNPVILGNLLTYSMTVTNNGPNTATGIALSQTLPSSVQIVSTSASQGIVTTNSGNTVTCNLGTLFAGQTATVTVVVFPEVAGTIFSTATVGAQQTDFNLANNTVTLGTVVQSPTSDLAVGLTANPSPVLVGSLFNYTASVTNNGPSTASGVKVTNTLPANVTFISASSSQGTCSSIGNQVICTLGTLLQGSNATATIQVRALNVGTITATAVASGNQTDPVPVNNTVSVTTTVTPAADLSLAMSGPPSVIVNSNATYKITVQNLGPSPATGVIVNDTLPAGVTVVSVTNLQGGYSISNGAVACTLTNTLAAGAIATITITINTSPLNGQVPLAIVNSAGATADQSDPFTPNNSASVSTYVDYPRVNVVGNGATLVSVGGAPTNGMINPGQTVTVNFSLQNIGNINATNISATLLGTGGVVTNSSQTKSYGTL